MSKLKIKHILFSLYFEDLPILMLQSTVCILCSHLYLVSTNEEDSIWSKFPASQFRKVNRGSSVFTIFLKDPCSFSSFTIGCGQHYRLACSHSRTLRSTMKLTRFAVILLSTLLVLLCHSRDQLLVLEDVRIIFVIKFLGYLSIGTSLLGLPIVVGTW